MGSEMCIRDRFRTYLSDRKQRVVMGGFASDWVTVTSGVPQGSILGPSLFIMYINDLPSSLSNSQCLLYADDVKVYKRISCFSDCLELQCDLSSFSEWCCQWKLNLNFSKCFFMNFSLKRKFDILYDYSLCDNFLQCASHIKDLGVTFSSNLSFNVHITNVVNEALRMLGFIRRTLRYPVLLKFYTIHIMFDPASIIVPSTKSYITKIEPVQKRFLRVLCFKAKMTYDRDKYKEMCCLFNLTTLEHRRKVFIVLLFHKILHLSLIHI